MSSSKSGNSPKRFAGYPQQGEVIDGKYLVEEILGEGGMGGVVRALHVKRKAPVALKFMAPALARIPGATERFANEAVAASQIRSDHVVTIHDVGALPNDTPYIVMELLEGRDLGAVLAMEGRPGLPLPHAVHFVAQILRGLQAAHSAGIIHRDIKPSNCFVVTKDGEPDFLKLVDFGISKLATDGDAELTGTNMQLGSPAYMSPEQLRASKDVDSRCDLFSTGVVLYKLAAGRLPYDKHGEDVIEGPLLASDGSVAGDPLPAAFVDVVRRALAKDPAKRFQTAAEFAMALEPFADERAKRTLARIKHVQENGTGAGVVSRRNSQHAAPRDPASHSISVRTQTVSSVSNPGSPGDVIETRIDSAMRRMTSGAPGAVSTAEQAPTHSSYEVNTMQSRLPTGEKPRRNTMILVGAIAAVVTVGTAFTLSHRQAEPPAQATTPPKAPSPLPATPTLPVGDVAPPKAVADVPTTAPPAAHLEVPAAKDPSAESPKAVATASPVPAPSTRPVPANGSPKAGGGKVKLERVNPYAKDP
ncbi:MAG: protein kinase [Polyangiaceae bacterium]